MPVTGSGSPRIGDLEAGSCGHAGPPGGGAEQASGSRPAERSDRAVAAARWREIDGARKPMHRQGRNPLNFNRKPFQRLAARRPAVKVRPAREPWHSVAAHQPAHDAADLDVLGPEARAAFMRRVGWDSSRTLAPRRDRAS